MAKEIETIEDIVGDIRAQNQGLPEDATALSPLVCDLLNLADRLDAAHKRERGDCAKLREALKATLDLFFDIHNANRSPQSNQAYTVIRKIKAALAAPPRNCDVGTVKDQFARFRKFCKKDSMDSFAATAYCAYECPCGNNHDCKLAWAQMPYEGGAK